MLLETLEPILLLPETVEEVLKTFSYVFLKSKLLFIEQQQKIVQSRGEKRVIKSTTWIQFNVLSNQKLFINLPCTTCHDAICIFVATAIVSVVVHPEVVSHFVSYRGRYVEWFPEILLNIIIITFYNK